VVILGDTERERDALGTEVLPTGSDTRAVLLALSRGASTRAPLGPTTHLDEAARLKALTRQERTILRLIAEGQPNREIARTLELSQHTVRTHKQNLYQKLGCHRRLDIVRLAMRHGLVTERGG
jgi:DNA-binding CsgD family transcriptional regulator